MSAPREAYTMKQVKAVLAGSARLTELQGQIKRFLEIFTGIVNSCLGPDQVDQEKGGDIILKEKYPLHIRWEVKRNTLHIWLIRSGSLGGVQDLKDPLRKGEVVRIYKALPLIVNSIAKRLGEEMVSMVNLEQAIRNDLGFFEGVATEKL